MNIAIVDDNAADRLRLEQMLKQYDTMNRLGLRIVHFSSGEELLKDYQPFQYTVIFLDIYMGGLSGIETAEKLRAVDDDSILIFMTTSESHRSEAFSVFATAYLSKPVTDEKVFRTMDHILRRKTERENRFSFAFDRQEYSLRYSEICSIETAGNYLLIKDREGKTYRTRMTFTHAEQMLDSRFLILMKGIIVNMDYIERIKETQCVMKGGSIFPLHVKNAKELQQKWLNYKFTVIREATIPSGGRSEC